MSEQLWPDFRRSLIEGEDAAGSSSPVSSVLPIVSLHRGGAGVGGGAGQLASHCRDSNGLLCAGGQPTLTVRGCQS